MDVTIYATISNEVWQLFKKWMASFPKDSKEFDKCFDEFQNLANKYPDYYGYAYNYALTCANEIERIWRIKKL